ncbi:hypothetical protein M9H77_29082 [Catharanthus roseus]|uniref:Uncharacterized protein n=1 Tax=Catharanthus roseus TaxID=4058 RepID=A0ACC0AI50_CATRO|nr:hypothetical protein M9H77_29082 [Catharanthus roseus]
MGVNFPAITFRAPPSRTHSQNRQFQPNSTNVSSIVGNRRNNKSKKSRAAITNSTAVDEEERRRWRKRRWWRLCRDDGDCRPTASLGEFLEVERRFGDGAFYGGGAAAAAEIEGIVPVVDDHHHSRNGRVLFADGRVLPPAEVVDDDAESPAAVAAGGLCRFSVVSLSGICSGGAV